MIGIFFKIAVFQFKLLLNNGTKFGAPGNRTPLEKVKYMDKKNLDLAPYLIALVISILIGSYLISNSIKSGNENKKDCL